jgi:hypothetical protein
VSPAGFEYHPLAGAYDQQLILSKVGLAGFEYHPLPGACDQQHILSKVGPAGFEPATKRNMDNVQAGYNFNIYYILSE